MTPQTRSTTFRGAILAALILPGITLPMIAMADAPPPANADEVAALNMRLAQMSESMRRMQQNMAEVQAELARMKTTTPSAQPLNTIAANADSWVASRERIAALEEQVEALGKSDWTDKISMKGDFRYRFENIDEQGRAERERQRLRARLEIAAKVNDNTKVGIRLASGGTDPVSTNQSFDTLATTKDLRLDRAYVQYAFTDQLNVTGGKMGVSFYKPGKSTLLWDGDLNPEGLAFSYKNNGLFASAANWVLEESSSGDDSYMHGLQAGYTMGAGAGKLTFGAGYFLYDFSSSLGFDKVENVELFADYATELMDRPLVAYLDYVTNNEANQFENGYRVGFNYGKVKAAGSWDFGLSYNEVEANALFGQFSESDFAGGGTDGEGWIVKGGYGLGSNASFGATYFINERAIDSTKTDYDRLQLDLKYKF